MTTEFWMHKDFANPAASVDDLCAMAVNFTIEDCARRGFRIDRLKPMHIEQTSAYWRFEIPVVKVVR